MEEVAVGVDKPTNTHGREEGERNNPHEHMKDTILSRRHQREQPLAEIIETSVNSTLGASKSDQGRKVVEGFPASKFAISTRSSARSKEVLVNEHISQGMKPNIGIGAPSPYTCIKRVGSRLGPNN